MCRFLDFLCIRCTDIPFATPSSTFRRESVIFWSCIRCTDSCNPFCNAFQYLSPRVCDFLAWLIMNSSEVLISKQLSVMTFRRSTEPSKSPRLIRVAEIVLSTERAVTCNSLMLGMRAPSLLVLTRTGFLNRNVSTTSKRKDSWAIVAKWRISLMEAFGLISSNLVWRVSKYLTTRTGGSWIVGGLSSFLCPLVPLVEWSSTPFNGWPVLSSVCFAASASTTAGGGRE